jgi:hypothetical protein
MPRNAGIFTPVNGTWSNGASNGIFASLADWKALLEDLSEALTQSVAKDGQTVFTSDLQMGGNKLTGLAKGTAVGDSLAWEQLFSQGVETDIASAATLNIGAQNSNFLRVTGTTTITSFGTSYNGPRYLRFADACQITNSSTLVLPGGTNFTTSAGDVIVAIPKATSGTPDGWYVVSVPQSLVQYVTLGGTETLTNKTLTSPVITQNVQVISTNTTAVRSRVYVMTASLTLTLPSSPTAGDTVMFSNRSTTTTPVIARNGQNIMGLAEDMTLDNVNHFGVLVFSDSTRGWIFN